MEDHPAKSRRHPVMRVLIALEWLFVLWLALESVEAGRSFIAERAYQDYNYQQNLKVYGMAPTEEQDVKANPFIGRQEASVLWEGKESILDAAAITIPDDVLEMVFQGKMRALFDKEGHLLESCGEPLIEQDLLRHMHGLQADAVWGKLLQAVRDDKEYLEARCTLTLGTPVHYAVSLKKMEDAGAKRFEVVAQDINDQMPLEALHYGEVPGPDSPWEIMFYRYKKNWSVPDNTLLQTNEFGFRDHAIAMPKPEGVYRIVCIGGSTTEEGNTTDATYPKIVERKLAERFSEGQIEVINAGTCGTNTYNMRRRFGDFLALQPDLILFYGGVNDTTHLHSQFWLDAVPRWKKWARRSFIINRYFGFYLLPGAEELSSYMRDTTYRNLLSMRHAARKQGVEMAWCSFAYPTLHWYDMRAKNYYDINMRDVWHGQGLINFRAYCRVTDVFNQTGRDIAQKEGVPWFPVAEQFVAGADHFFDICHMTPQGLELKTDIFSGLIADYLQRQGWLTAPVTAAP